MQNAQKEKWPNFEEDLSDSSRLVTIKITKGSWGDSPISEVITVRPEQAGDSPTYYGVNEYGTFKLTLDDVKAIMEMEGKSDDK